MGGDPNVQEVLRVQDTRWLNLRIQPTTYWSIYTYKKLVSGVLTMCYCVTMVQYDATVPEGSPTFQTSRDQLLSLCLPYCSIVLYPVTKSRSACTCCQAD